jgi:protein-S-isoprenylcysteine O-methyltransferase Ste14
MHRYSSGRWLFYIYVRLAGHEEQMALREFGDVYRNYMAITPAWIPRLSATGHATP